MNTSKPGPRRLAAAALLALLATAVAACGSPAPARPGVPSDRSAALHRAADCIRGHGIPAFHDPTVGADGQVFTDTRPLQDASDGTIRAVRAACQDLVAAADWNPEQQPPAPPALVAAGARAARCMRAHGLPNFRDPGTGSAYTPGHGFAMQDDELPPGAGKSTPVVAQAMQACRAMLDAEIRASTLDRLADR